MKTPRIVLAFLATLAIAGCANRDDPKEQAEIPSDMPPSEYVVRCDAVEGANVNDFLTSCRRHTEKLCPYGFEITAAYGEVKNAPYWVLMGINCKKGIKL